MGFILTIVATILMYVFVPIGIITSFFFTKRSRYWMDIAISLDQLGNVTCQHLFNVTLKKKKGYRFGKPDETISSCVGKNKRKGTLTYLGSIVAMILDKLDYNHSINLVV
jgi:hypothetical protein